MGRLRIDSLCGIPRPLAVREEVVAARCYVARGLRPKIVGLLGTPDLGPDEALWLPHCSSVHTFGMRIEIAVCFLDRGGRVLRLVDPLPAWRMVWVRGAGAAVEARPGTFARIAAGDRLTLAGSPSEQ